VVRQLETSDAALKFFFSVMYGQVGVGADGVASLISSSAVVSSISVAAARARRKFSLTGIICRRAHWRHAGLVKVWRAMKYSLHFVVLSTIGFDTQRHRAGITANFRSV